MIAVAFTVSTTDWCHQTCRTAGLLVLGQWLVASQTNWGGVHSRTHHERFFLQDYFSCFDVTWCHQISVWNVKFLFAVLIFFVLVVIFNKVLVRSGSENNDAKYLLIQLDRKDSQPFRKYRYLIWTQQTFCRPKFSFSSVNLNTICLRP